MEELFEKIKNLVNDSVLKSNALLYSSYSQDVLTMFLTSVLVAKNKVEKTEAVKYLFNFFLQKNGADFYRPYLAMEDISQNRKALVDVLRDHIMEVGDFSIYDGDDSSNRVRFTAPFEESQCQKSFICNLSEELHEHDYNAIFEKRHYITVEYGQFGTFLPYLRLNDSIVYSDLDAVLDGLDRVIEDYMNLHISIYYALINHGFDIISLFPLYEMVYYDQADTYNGLNNHLYSFKEFYSSCYTIEENCIDDILRGESYQFNKVLFDRFRLVICNCITLL